MKDIRLFKQSYEDAKKSWPDLGRLELIGIVCSNAEISPQGALSSLKNGNACPKETTHIFGISIQPNNQNSVFCYGDAYKFKNIQDNVRYKTYLDTYKNFNN